MAEIEQVSEMQRRINECFLIDKKFCDVTQKRIAVVMGKIASLPDFNGANAEILDELADIRSFFNWKDLRTYSNKLKDSIDMERFAKPWMPTGKN